MVKRAVDNMKFTISENGAVKKGLVDYIKKQLQLLKEMSTLTADALKAKQRDFIKAAVVNSIMMQRRFTTRRAALRVVIL